MLVTGGSGFIGSHLANYLKHKGHFVRVADIRSSHESYLKLDIDQFMELDLKVPEHAFRAVKGMECVFNLATEMGGLGYISGGNDVEIMHNAIIHLNVLDACSLLGVPRIFFSSSACVYNRQLQSEPDSKPLKESDDLPAWPDSRYGLEKFYSEWVYSAYAEERGMEVRIARFHNIYGPYCTWNNGAEKAPAALCRKVAETKDGGEIVVWGDGIQRRSYMYVEDCCEGIYRLVTSNYDKPLNLGTCDSIGVDELAYLIMNIAGKKLTIKHDLSKPQGVRGRNADLTLMKKILKWEPTTSTRKGMEQLYAWVNEQAKAT